MDFWSYVRKNALAEPAALRLAAAGKTMDFDVQSAIIQIEARRKFAQKFASTLAAYPEFLFPSLLAGEQATSDLLADYHAGLCAQGLSCADLTSGLGIDVLNMCRRASAVVAVERNEALAKALQHNAVGLHADNITVICADCRPTVEQWAAQGRHFDVVFIDPARRGADGSRVFGLADCEPDVCAMMPMLQKICRLLIIKASPMLDVSAAVKALGRVPMSVVALGTPTECKELLMVVDFASEAPAEPVLEAVTLKTDGSGASTFAFARSRELDAAPAPYKPAPACGNIVCEPYPAVMKMAPFRLLAHTYGLCAFGPAAHLYYSPTAPEAFPGRLYKIEAVLPYASKIIKRLARQYPKAQVAARNFGISAEDLRAKLGIRQGDDVRIFGITDADNERKLIVTSPLEG